MDQLAERMNDLALAKDCTAAAEMDRNECAEDVKRAEQRLSHAEWRLRDCIDDEVSARKALHSLIEAQTHSGIEEAEVLLLTKKK